MVLDNSRYDGQAQPRPLSKLLGRKTGIENPLAILLRDANSGVSEFNHYRIGRGPQEALDLQVLLDPFEEQLDLPACLIDRPPDREMKQVDKKT